ncbi:MAG: peptidylprolyl isomerase [Clostridia bacterium]|nr:peptidylprolyl isomerase [Clostridia bacterium]
MVRIEMENGGIIDIELYEDKAPITCANFKKLVSSGFYDGLIFHRVIAGFMVQGGDPTGTGCGGSSENIKGEFAANGVKNDISHVRGVISMARSQSMNSASSQFFIMHADGKFLDGQYAAFGKVVSGIEVVDEIAGVKTDFRDRPIIDMRMKKVTLI